MLKFPRQGEPPHFNTGHCITPRYLTGLEISEGVMSMVKWTERDGRFTRSVLRQASLPGITIQRSVASNRQGVNTD